MPVTKHYPSDRRVDATIKESPALNSSQVFGDRQRFRHEIARQSHERAESPIRLIDRFVTVEAKAPPPSAGTESPRTPTDQTARTIYTLLTNGADTNPTLVRQHLEKLTPSERVQVREELKRFGVNIETPHKVDPTSPLHREKTELIQNCHAVRELYAAMKGGVLGLGTDERRIFVLLASKSAREIEQIVKLYHEHYGRDLVRDLRHELKDNNRFLETLDIVLRGDQVRSAAAVIRLETKLPASDIKVLLELLSGKTPQERIQIRKAYVALYGETMETHLQNALKRFDLDRALGIVQNDASRSDAALIRLLLDRPTLAHREEILTILSSKSREELQTLQSKYQEKYGTSLAQHLAKYLPSTELEQAKAYLNGDPHLADAIRLRDAIVRRQNVSEVVYDLFHNRSVTERDRTITIYRDIFGSSVLRDLESISGQSPALRHAQLTLVREGRIDPVTDLYLALRASQERKGQVLAVVKDLESSEIERTKVRFETDLGRSVDHLIQEGFVRSDRFDVRLALLGRVENLEQRLWNVEALYQFERPQAHRLAVRALDTVSEHGQFLDRNMDQAQRLYERSRRDLQLLEDEQGPLAKLLQFVEDDVALYRETRERLIRSVSTILGVLCFLFTFMLLHTRGLPMWQTLLCSTGAGGLVGWLTSSLLHSHRSERRDLIERVRRRRELGQQRAHKLTSRSERNVRRASRRLTRSERAKLRRQ